MATVVFRGGSAATLKYRNIIGVLGCMKNDSVLKLRTVRFHHAPSDLFTNDIRRSQHKLYVACIRGIQGNRLGITASRAASTGVHHEVRWDVNDSRLTQSGQTDSIQNGTSVVNGALPDPTQNGSSAVNGALSPTSSASVQNASSINSEILPSIGNIPEPPPIPPDVQQVVETISGEPTFASLGLGSWTPVGMVQQCMEYLHIICDLPWWTAIIIGTVVVRVLMFPLVIMSQRNAAKMSNNMPQLQTLQLKMSEARQTGNQLEAARYAQEMVLFMKEKQLNPFKNVLVPLAQAPLFISFFMGLRGMANVPVDSMRTGGLFWFTDLTVPDQYYLMPLITSFTMWITIEVGADGTKLSAGNLQTMRYVLRALPVVILPFTVNFPGAILVYWCSTNFISLMQVGFLRIPTVRDFFKIEKIVNHNPDSLPVKPKGFVEGIQESWTNMKITKELEERQRFDELQFQRDGKGPIQKTYKYDPTRPKKNIDIGKDAIAAKKQDR